MEIYGLCSDLQSEFLNLKIDLTKIPLLENQRIVCESLIDIIMRNLMIVQKLTNGFQKLEHGDFQLIKMVMTGLEKSIKVYMSNSIDDRIRKHFFRTTIVIELILNFCELNEWDTKNPFH